VRAGIKDGKSHNQLVVKKDERKIVFENKNRGNQELIKG
jgi:hypothetical protein